ncbi:MAG: serine/threonine-protein kinase [Candidatus Micrarchaeota archaeon]
MTMLHPGRAMTGAATPKMQVPTQNEFAAFFDRLDGPANLEGRIVDGRYRIGTVIGSGNMCDVYSAIDESGRKVALKFAADRLATPIEESSRFLRREIEALSRISQENVVGFVDVGFAEGMEFLVMEYLEGMQLERIIGPGLPWEYAKPFLTQLCNALEAAHNAAVVHGDLKPGNILVLDDEGRRILKLIDFGLAKFTDAPDGDAERTPPGVIAGTIAYMAPEQLAGKDFDRKADIHAAGVIMYEMLSGRRPYDAGSFSAYAIVEQIRKARPLPLSELGVIIPGGANAVMMRALEKDPEKRFQTAAEMREAIASL